MTTIFVAGYKELAGKTTICVALGKVLQANGIKTDYIRVSDAVEGEGLQNATLDQEFVSTAISSTSGTSSGLPIVLKDSTENIKEAVSAATQDSSAVTLVELPGTSEQSTAASILPITHELSAQLLVVVKYHQKLTGQELADLLGTAKQRVAGIILNSLPRKQFSRISEALASSFEEVGFKVIATLPEDRALYGFTIGEMAAELGGQFICHPEMADKLIEHVMLGANAADPAYTYFSPRPNKAVFCRSDRPDIQLAALDTETRCLVLTGSGHYQQNLVYRAEDLGVAVLRVNNDTYSTIIDLNKVFPKVRFRHVDKVARAVGLLSEATDIPRLIQLVSSSSISPSS